MIDNTVDHVNNDGRTPQECVDRNNLFYGGHLKTTCRTPQECVDRNSRLLALYPVLPLVALHRSAWIEIALGYYSGRIPE